MINLLDFENDYLFSNRFETLQAKLYFKEVNAYDIHLFNYFGEYEVLLEPETKYVINECEEFNEIINLSCKIVESKTVLRKVMEGNNNKIKGKIIN